MLPNKLVDFLKNSQRYQQYVDNAPYGIILISAQGKYVDFNQATCDITQYQASELLFMSLDRITPANALKENLSAFAYLMKVGKLDAELAFLKKNGQTGFWRMKANQLSEQIYLAFVQETTLERQLQQNLEKKLIELQTLNKLMIDRELKMIQLKEEIKALKSKLLLP